MSTAPVTNGHWTYYGPVQGLSQDIRDVSADEGGDVYVAGGDALYVKQRADEKFLRFDADNAGLSRLCNDPADMMNDVPAAPFHQCPVISVAGAAPGKAIVGFEGLGQEADGGAWWALKTGGADVVAFDPAAKALSRTRHVFVASPPHVVCGTNGEAYAPTCISTDVWWQFGRRLVRSIHRVAVNHDPSSPMYGDAWMGGNHGTFSALLNNAGARGLVDRTDGWGPNFADARDVWEHLHPGITGILGEFLVGEGDAMSIDPRTGIPWGSNGIRTTSVVGYGPNLSGVQWDMSGAIDLWTDSGDPWSGPTNDHVVSISHCQDGTLWIGSNTHGLARLSPDGSIDYPALPDTVPPNVTAVACDPSDASVWIGLSGGGVLRLHDGVFDRADTTGMPEFSTHAPASIQLDRWSSPRVVYVAFAPVTDATGKITSGGGVASYDGP